MDRRPDVVGRAATCHDRRMADGKLTAVVSVRFTEEEAVELREHAGARPVSHLVRELAVERLRFGQGPCLPAPVSSTSPSANRPQLISESSIGHVAQNGPALIQF